MKERKKKNYGTPGPVTKKKEEKREKTDDGADEGGRGWRIVSWQRG